jgi:hypothetical protein
MEIIPVVTHALGVAAMIIGIVMGIMVFAALVAQLMDILFGGQ